jgi:hypothetical protein
MPIALGLWILAGCHSERSEESSALSYSKDGIIRVHSRDPRKIFRSVWHQTLTRSATSFAVIRANSRDSRASFPFGFGPNKAWQWICRVQPV